MQRTRSDRERREEIAKLVADFDRAAIDRARWTHEAHLTVAAWHLLSFPYDAALSQMRAGIQRLNAANSVAQTPTGGYHETITQLYMQLVAQAIDRVGRDGPIDRVIGEVVARCFDRDLPLRFYTRETLKSWTSRTSWVEPDIAPIVLP